MKLNNTPRILLLDIETSPIITYAWALFDQILGLGQIKEDWYILSVAAKWLGEKEIIYADQRNIKNKSDDRRLLKIVWELLDQADILITQNGVSFDTRKLNARFILNGMQPPSSYKNIDTCLIARKRFKFTSNKLEYLTDKLCKKYKKFKHRIYPGLELWKAVLAGKRDAWKEMEKYNKYDVLSLEELYTKLIPWDSSINFSLYSDNAEHVCSCGSKKFIKKGFFYTGSGKFQRYKCKKCGAEMRDKNNLFIMKKRKSLMMGVK